jgi:phosphatidate cytidylyltransferase
MPLNIQTLKTRALTAVVFVAVMLTGLFWNRWAFITLFTLIHFGAWWEWVKLLRRIDPKHYLRRIPLGLLYITLPCALLVHLRLQGILYKGDEVFIDMGWVAPCFIIFSIWINDTMAYIVGSLIGKTPLSSISPKKTWEGTIGGILLCIVAMTAIALWQDWLSALQAIVASGIIAITGTVGDLFESKLKRMAGVKDSGNFMPGHGGFLDRFDSLLIATPFFWLYLQLA